MEAGGDPEEIARAVSAADPAWEDAARRAIRLAAMAGAGFN